MITKNVFEWVLRTKYQNYFAQERQAWTGGRPVSSIWTDRDGGRMGKVVVYRQIRTDYVWYP